MLVRFRLGTDAAAALAGWNIDDIEVTGITNTPFPLLVTEPSTCTAREAPAQQMTVEAIHAAPATSLAAFDSAVCIATDTP
jgi:endo-alpha-1,4-polygalactosaminidase (GH114 family)